MRGARSLRPRQRGERMMAPIGLALLLATMVCVAAAEAQPGDRAKRVAALWNTTETAAAPYIRDVEKVLASRGWVDGRNISFQHRFTDAKPERLEAVAREVVDLEPDVIFTGVNSGALALKRLTTNIPIVIGYANNPVEAGLVASVARPGANITGLLAPPPGIYGKRLQILTETFPDVRHVVVFGNAAEAIGNHQNWLAIGDAAATLGIALVDASLERPADISRVIDAARAKGAEAIIGIGDNLAFLHRHEVAASAGRLRLPTIFGTPEYCHAGALLLLRQARRDVPAGGRINGPHPERHRAWRVAHGAAHGVPVDRESTSRRGSRYRSAVFPRRPCRRGDRVR
jgi:putative tryptophan/tyrosine transport system substrate-binding protein